MEETRWDKGNKITVEEKDQNESISIGKYVFSNTLFLT